MNKDYIDLGATTAEAMEISRRSRRMVAGFVGDESPEDRIRQRCVIATGDPSVAGIMRFVKEPVSAGLRALDQGAPIYVDIRMVDAGVTRKGHKSEVRTFIGRGDLLAASRGITRTSAGVLASEAELSGSIVAIGNAPSALMTLCQLMESGTSKPALVIGTPVGFVNAAESKERLREIDVPSVSTEGTRGGSPIAVAALNEIITIYYQSCSRSSPGER